ncbi:hypothetical protein [Coraliomargarita akajimensis]|uniref:Uncharacterized protein n=1 Tax=Coraliomargarita akajimensis (strain DSM 45221 / IAM 15411 / JCM 23193 / KCTC 12865 / 04OKA010-24) TaxID=583355 RepID=D5ELA4_CORAD|nr:hypothetical protein [Coraliomargarita akajimensis]ADE55040.1 hypothetical protein Caka_2022 [Coraliomargarita akajimensis DSM 45221]
MDYFTKLIGSAAQRDTGTKEKAETLAKLPPAGKCLSSSAYDAAGKSQREGCFEARCADKTGFDEVKGRTKRKVLILGIRQTNLHRFCLPTAVS